MTATTMTGNHDLSSGNLLIQRNNARIRELPDTGVQHSWLPLRR